MTNFDPTSLPAPTFAGGTKAITMTPIVGTPRREYAEMYVPGEEPLEDGGAARDGAGQRQPVGMEAEQALHEHAMINAVAAGAAA